MNNKGIMIIKCLFDMKTIETFFRQLGFNNLLFFVWTFPYLNMAEYLAKLGYY